MKSSLLIAVTCLVLVLTACQEIAQPPTTPVPGDSDTISSQDTPPASGEVRNPLEPIPGEEDMLRGEAFIESAQVAVLESFPVQISLALTGNLPTPCHYLRAKVEQPDAQSRIYVDVYSLAKPGEACAQMLVPFETNLPLGSYASGKYTVFVNGKQVGEFSV